MVKRFGKILLYLILLVGCLAMAVVALNPQWRQKAQRMVFPKERVVLSSVWGQFSVDSPRMKAVKSLDSRGVFVEIFVEEPDKTLKLISTLVTGHPHDGQFNFKGHMSRLVAADIDEDGMDELLVPTFDSSMRPNLGLYKYQPNTKEFQKIVREL